VSKRKVKFQNDPDECAEEMGWCHSQSQENNLVCPDCGLDFRFDPPRINMGLQDDDLSTPFRFYGVDKDGWLVGAVTKEYDINRWIVEKNIDTEKPHGRRPTPDYIEADYLHGPFYVSQEIIDELWS